MDSGTALHFFSGKMAAKKSTLAKQLTKKHNCILFVEDEWLLSLYPNTITDIPTYIKHSERLKNTLRNHFLQLLSNKQYLVLDFPANTINQRRWFRELIDEARVSHTLHFIDKSDEQCKQQLKQRSKDMPEGTALTSATEFDAITQYFQPPEENENFNLIHYTQ
jgi:predicted kinase